MSLSEQLQSQRIIYPSERQRRALKKSSAQRKLDQLKQRPTEVQRRHDPFSSDVLPAVKRSRKLAQRKRRTLMFLPEHLATVPFHRLTDFAAMAGDAAVALGRLAASTSSKYTSYETVCSENRAGAAGDLDVLDPDEAADLLAMLKDLVSLLCISLPGSATASARETPSADALLLFEYLAQRFRVHVRLNESLLLWLLPHVGRPLYALVLACSGTPLESSPFAFLFGECRDRALAWRDLPDRDVAQAAQVVSVAHLGRRCWIDVRLARLIARTCELRVADDSRWAQLFAMVFVDSIASVPGSNRRQLAAQVSCLLPLVQSALACPLPDPDLALSAAMVLIAIVRATRGTSSSLFPPTLSTVCAGSLLDSAARYATTTALNRMLVAVSELCQTHSLSDGQLPRGPLRRFVAAVCAAADQPRYPFRDLAGGSQFLRRNVAPSLLSQALLIWAPNTMEFDPVTVGQFSDAWADCALKLDQGEEPASGPDFDDYGLLESAIHELVTSAHPSVASVALTALLRRCKPHDHPVGVRLGNPLARLALARIRGLLAGDGADANSLDWLLSVMKTVGVPLKRRGRPPALIVRSHVTLVQSTSSAAEAVASSLGQLVDRLKNATHQSSSGNGDKPVDQLSNDDLNEIRNAAVYALAKSPHRLQPVVQTVACEILVSLFSIAGSDSTSFSPSPDELVSMVPSLIACGHRNRSKMASHVAGLVGVPVPKRSLSSRDWNLAILKALAKSDLARQYTLQASSADKNSDSSLVIVASLCSSLPTLTVDEAVAVLLSVGQILFRDCVNFNVTDLEQTVVDQMTQSILGHVRRQEDRKMESAQANPGLDLALVSSCSECAGSDRELVVPSLLDEIACLAVQCLSGAKKLSSTKNSGSKKKKKKITAPAADDAAEPAVRAFVMRALLRGRWLDAVPRSVWMAQPSPIQLASIWLTAVGPDPSEQAVVVAVRALTLLTALVRARSCIVSSVDPVLVVPTIGCPVKHVRRAGLQLVAALTVVAGESHAGTGTVDPIVKCLHQFSAELTLDHRFLAQALVGNENLAAGLLNQFLASQHTAAAGPLAPGSWPCMRLLDGCTLIKCSPAVDGTVVVDFETLVSGLSKLTVGRLLPVCSADATDEAAVDADDDGRIASHPVAAWYTVASTLKCLQRLFQSVTARSSKTVRNVSNMLLAVVDRVTDTRARTADEDSHDCVTVAGLAAVDLAQHFIIVGTATTQDAQLIRNRVLLTSALARLAVAGTGSGQLCTMARTVARRALGPGELAQLKSMLSTPASTATTDLGQLIATLESLEPVITLPELSPLLVNLVALVRSCPPSADYVRRLAMTRAVQLASSLEMEELADRASNLDLLAVAGVVAGAVDQCSREQQRLALLLLRLVSSAQLTLDDAARVDGRAGDVLFQLAGFDLHSCDGVYYTVAESWRSVVLSWASLAAKAAVAGAAKPKTLSVSGKNRRMDVVSDNRVDLVAQACILLHTDPAVLRQTIRHVSTIFCQHDDTRDKQLSFSFVCRMFIHSGDGGGKLVVNAVDLCAALDPADIGPAEVAVRILTGSSVRAMTATQQDQLLVAATTLLLEHAGQVSPDDAVLVLAELMRLSFSADDDAVVCVLARADPRLLAQFLTERLISRDASSAVQLIKNRLLMARSGNRSYRRAKKFVSGTVNQTDESRMIQLLYPILLQGALSGGSGCSRQQHEFVAACEHVLVQFADRPQLLSALADAGLVQALVAALDFSVNSEHASTLLRAAVLLWCSSAAVVLGTDRLVAVLPKLVPLFLRCVHAVVSGGAEVDGENDSASSSDDDRDLQQLVRQRRLYEQCCGAAARALCSLIKGLPGGLLSPWMSPMLTLSLVPVFRVDENGRDAGFDRGRDSPALHCLLALASTMPPRVWPKSLPRAGLALLKRRDWRGLTLLFRATEATAANATADVGVEVPPLALAVLECIGLVTDDMPADEVHQILAAAAQAYVALTLRLSEPAFRPLFVRSVAWAFDPSATASGHGSSAVRVQFFFGLAEQLARCLKSLFNPFTKLFFPALLQNLHRDRGAAVWSSAACALRWICVHGGVPRPSAALAAGSKRSAASSASGNAAEPAVVENQWLESAVDALVSLLDLVALDNTVDKMERRRWRSLVQTTVIPCVVALATGASSDHERRRVLKSVLMSSRHADKRVRLISLSVVAAVFNALSEDNALSLIPDSVPFLAELADDPNSDVAMQATDLVSRLESVLGPGTLNTFF